MSDRSVFLYLEPKGDGDSQCGTCFLWVKNRRRCYIHGPEVEVKGSMACCYWLPGRPTQGRLEHIPSAKVTPEESGLVDRQVRCENCKWFNGGECGFFSLLNTVKGLGLKLDTRVSPKGCCTAQEPKGESRARRERLEGASL